MTAQAHVIIDTNVLVVANGQNDHVSQDCSDACVEFVAQVCRDKHVILDADDEVRKEYAGVLKTARPYGIGAMLLFQILQQRRVKLVEIIRSVEGNYVDFPIDPALASFDRSDRKFAALGKKTRVPVTNAADSDWKKFERPLRLHGIHVIQLCKA